MNNDIDVIYQSFRLLNIAVCIPNVVKLGVQIIVPWYRPEVDATNGHRGLVW